MNKLTLSQLRKLLRWASRQRDKKGRSLLERAKDSLIKGTYRHYNVEVEISAKESLADGHPKVYFDCTCPAINKGRYKDKPCKHVVAKMVLVHENLLRQSSEEWDRWFEEYHQAEAERIEEALKAFEAFEAGVYK